MKEEISLFTEVMDWLQEKLKTRFGFFILGALFSFLITFAFLGNSNERVNELREQNVALQEQLQTQQAATKEWQDRWAESERGAMERLRNTMDFLQELEDTYNEKYTVQADRSKEVNQQINELRAINKRLEKLENQNTDEK